MVSADRQLIDKLNRLINDKLDSTAFTVDTICQTLGVSRSQLHRIIKEQTGLSTSLYIRKRRLLEASHLLVDTDWRIAEIGDAVGINNPQNFSTYFIEEFGASPTEFRKQRTQRPAAAEPGALPKPLPAAVKVPIPDADYTNNLPGHYRIWHQRRWLYGGFIIGVLVLIGAGLYSWFQARPSGHATQPGGHSLAVLPFVNLGTSDGNLACESMMDDIHRSVSLIRNLTVISRASSDKYRDTPKSIWQIGDELRASNILKGSILRNGEQIQVKVSIIDAQNDILRWGHTYTVAYKNIFSLTDQIAQDVARQLKLPNAAASTERLAQIRTQNLDAYNLFLQGRQLLVSRLEADLWAGMHRFDQALALDSTFAEAYALKAAAYHLLTGSPKLTTQTINRLTEENALRAIRLEPANSTAHAVLGSLYFVTYQWQASENAFRIALQHNPNDAQANYWYSLLLRTTGRVNEAVAYSAKAIALDPLHPIMLAGHIINCTYAGRLDEAQAAIEAGQALFDKSFAFQLAIASYWLMKADYSRAVAAHEQAQRLNPDDKGQVPVQLYCEAKRGNRQKAVTVLRHLTATTPRADYERAVVYAGLNQADSSLHYLKKAADGGYLYRDTKVLPVFRPYRSHPTFRAVMRQFKLPES